MNPHADPHITIAECRRIVATPPPDRGEPRWHIQSVDAFNKALATWQRAQTSCSKFLRDLPPGTLEKFDADHAEAVRLAQQHYAAEQSDQPDSLMEEDTELPLTQCPDQSRRVWEPEWLMVLVETFEPYQETFKRKKRDENGEARVLSVKEASELWAAFEEEFLTRMPMVRGHFKGKQPIKSKMLGLKEELKKTVEACGASGSGSNEKLAQPLFKRLMQMYQQDPLIVPKHFLDSHTAPSATTFDAAREAAREAAGTRTAETGIQPIAPINPVGRKGGAQQALPQSYLLTSQRVMVLDGDTPNSGADQQQDKENDSIIANSRLAQHAVSASEVVGARGHQPAKTPARARPGQGRKTPASNKANKRSSEYVDDDINDEFNSGRYTTAKRKQDDLVEVATNSISSSSVGLSDAMSHQGSLDRQSMKENTELIMKGQADIFSKLGKDLGHTNIMSSIIAKGGSVEEMKKMMQLFGVGPDMSSGTSTM